MISVILSFHQPRLKINSLTFLQYDFSKLNFLQKNLFKWGCGPRRARASAMRLPPIQIDFFEEDLALKNHVAKSQGIYLESGLIEA